MGWADRPGQQAGCWFGLGLSLVSDTSDRPGQQEVMLSQLSAHFRQKWPAKFWLGRGLGEGKSEDSLWRRDLSALGPFGAEANFLM